ncbi:MAG: permease [Thermoanaerobacteraceae bacterium]|nr:permease [Thermoanaerobacteraceae bacterium]
MCLSRFFILRVLYVQPRLGPLMALIIGGAGASIPEVALLASIFKPRLVAVFVLTIFTIAVLAGYALDIIFA